MSKSSRNDSLERRGIIEEGLGSGRQPTRRPPDSTTGLVIPSPPPLPRRETLDVPANKSSK